MALPQDISPVNSDVMDAVTRSAQMDWIETTPGTGYMKVLWYSADSGRWAVLLKWLKGHVARPHKHLSAAHAFMLSGKIQVRDTIYQTGDYLFEANGMVHDATTALEDTVFLFTCDGPVLYFDDDGFTGYMGWEQIQRLEAAHQAKVAAE